MCGWGARRKARAPVCTTTITTTCSCCMLNTLARCDFPADSWAAVDCPARGRPANVSCMWLLPQRPGLAKVTFHQSFPSARLRISRAPQLRSTRCSHMILSPGTACFVEENSFESCRRVTRTECALHTTPRHERLCCALGPNRVCLCSDSSRHLVVD